MNWWLLNLALIVIALAVACSKIGQASYWEGTQLKNNA